MLHQNVLESEAELVGRLLVELESQPNLARNAPIGPVLRHVPIHVPEPANAKPLLRKLERLQARLELRDENSASHLGRDPSRRPEKLDSALTEKAARPATDDGSGDCAHRPPFVTIVKVRSAVS